MSLTSTSPNTPSEKAGDLEVLDCFQQLKEPRPRMLASEKKIRIFFSTRESMQNDILTKQNFLPES